MYSEIGCFSRYNNIRRLQVSKVFSRLTLIDKHSVCGIFLWVDPSPQTLVRNGTTSRCFVPPTHHRVSLPDRWHTITYTTPFGPGRRKNLFVPSVSSGIVGVEVFVCRICMQGLQHMDRFSGRFNGISGFRKTLSNCWKSRIDMRGRTSHEFDCTSSQPSILFFPTSKQQTTSLLECLQKL